MVNGSAKYSRPEWIEALPSKFRELLQDLYVLVEQDLLRFVPAGLRTLIELVGREVLGGRYSFTKMLGGLHAKGLISKDEQDRLREVVEGAHAVVHDGEPLSRGAILHMLLCAERLLQSCFLLPQPHAELREVATRREAERRRQSK